MADGNERPLRSIEDVEQMLSQLTPQDTDDLLAVKERLIYFLCSEFIPPAATEILQRAHDALARVIDGESTDSDTALQGIVEGLQLAARAARGEAVADIAAKLEMEPTESASEPAPEPVAEEEAVAEPEVTVEPEPEAAAEPEPEPVAEEKAVAEPEVAVEPEPEAAAGPETAATFTLPEDTDVELLNEYITECNDHLEAAEAAMLDIENTPDDHDAINSIFRAFHTIKGTSGFLGLSHLQEIAHYAESILSDAREDKLELVGHYADLILECIDLLKSMIGDLDGTPPGTVLALPATFDTMLANLKDPDGAVEATPEEESTPEAAATEAGPDLSIVMPASEKESNSGLVAETPRVGDIMVEAGTVGRAELETVEAQKGEDVKIGQALVDAGAAESQDVTKALQKQKQIAKGSKAETSIRVGTNRLDSLIDMVGELVIAQSMVSQDPHVVDGSRPRLAKNVSHASKIVRELQDLTMGLRMVPLKGTFQKMTRLVRDLGRKGNKDVRFETAGEDTEIDRNIVEVLNDPLVHMIRNSVDHGLESVDERAKTSKPETGLVKLRAYQSAGSVVIELTDDGKGLNKEKIIAKAIANDLIRPDAVLSDPETFNLIFNPGFSTADKVTDISGRGVGMDVVKKSIESLRGRIELTSEVGVGTTFSLYLPLTMAITDAMILRVGAERYLLPTISIEQSFRPEEKSLFTVTENGEMVMLRGDLIPVVRLNQLFGFSEGIETISEGLLVCVEVEGKRCALMVDELLGQQQVVIKSLGDWMGEVPGISGGTILGDGRVGLILDAAGLLKISHAGAEKKSTPQGIAS